MTEDCWGNYENYVLSNYIAEAIHRALALHEISLGEFHFGIDDIIWEKLHASNDPLIKDRMEKIVHFKRDLTMQGKTPPSFKCRGIDPWIKKEGKIYRLTELDPEMDAQLRALKKRS